MRFEKSDLSGKKFVKMIELLKKTAVNFRD